MQEQDLLTSTTLSPDPRGGACVKTMTGRPFEAASCSSNQSSWVWSIKTSWTLWVLLLNRTVDSPKHSTGPSSADQKCRCRKVYTTCPSLWHNSLECTRISATFWTRCMTLAFFQERLPDRSLGFFYLYSWQKKRTGSLKANGMLIGRGMIDASKRQNNIFYSPAIQYAMVSIAKELSKVLLWPFARRRSVSFPCTGFRTENSELLASVQAAKLSLSVSNSSPSRSWFPVTKPTGIWKVSKYSDVTEKQCLDPALQQ